MRRVEGGTRLLGLALMVMPCFVTARAAGAPATPRRWHVLYPASAQPGLSVPTALAIDERGRQPNKWMYVVDTGNNRIVKLGTGGHFVLAWGSQGTGPGQFDKPQGVAVDARGSVYVTDTGNNRVEVFSPQGQFLEQWGTAGSGPGQLNTPIGIAIGGSGNVFVADHDNSRIEKFTSNGRLLATWPVTIPANIGYPGFGSSNGYPEHSTGTGPYALTIDGRGNVYTATDTGQCSGGHCVMDFIMLEARSPAGTVLWAAMGTGPYGGSSFSRSGPWWQIGSLTAGAHERLYLLEWNLQDATSVTVLSSVTLRQVDAWTLPPPSASHGWPGLGIALDPRGTVYVADTDANRILKLAATLRRWT